MKKSNKIIYQDFIPRDKLNSKGRKKIEKLIKRINKDLDISDNFFHSLSKKFKFNFVNHELQKYKKFKNVFIIGMGGSILGSEAIYRFLNEKIKKKFIFVDNIDEIKLKKINNKYNFNNSLFIIISKSGSTIETISNSLAMHVLKKNNRNVIVITEKNNPLYLTAKKMKLHVVEHKDYIGGRYSVLSEVGMVPSMLMGLNIKKIRKNLLFPLRKRNISILIRNIYRLSAFLKNKKINSLIFCNFVPELDKFLNWCQQLIAESLGKKKMGLLPFISNFPKDNHSLLQLYLDGPKDKIFYIFDIKDKNCINNLINPKIFGNEFHYLKKTNLAKIKNAQKKAFISILKRKKIPFREIIIQDKSEESIGELFALFMLETVLVGKNNNINPFNQPAVEELKKNTKKFLF